MRIGYGLLVLVAAALLGAATPARAQMAVYGEFTGANTGLSNTPHLYGATFGFYTTARMGLIALGPDLRGIIARHGSTTPNADQAMDFGLGGLRLAVTPRVLPIMPYLEVLGGVGYQRVGQGSTRRDKFSGAAQFLAGVDYTVIPRLDWRVVEFSYGRLGSSVGVLNPKTLSTGIVLRLP
jgi:hypothetical protein